MRLGAHALVTERFSLTKILTLSMIKDMVASGANRRMSNHDMPVI